LEAENARLREQLDHAVRSCDEAEWDADYAHATRRVVEVAYREVADTSFCIFCQTTMEKNLRVMLEHAQRCEKRPENVLLRRLEQAEAALQWRLAYERAMREVVEAALREELNPWTNAVAEALRDRAEQAEQALAAAREEIEEAT